MAISEIGGPNFTAPWRSYVKTASDQRRISDEGFEVNPYGENAWK
jgi:hypothetical protein